MTKIEIKEWLAKGNLIFISGVLFAFSLPFGKIFVPPFIGLFLLSVIISPGFGHIAYKGLTKIYLLLFSCFYLLHVAGLIWTENFQYALSDLEIKASLIIFPILFLFSPEKYFNSRFVKGITFSFFTGCFISVLISFCFAFNLYSKTSDICSFYYSTSSYFMHTSYLSLYIVFALFALYTKKYRPSSLFYIFYVIALILVFYLNLLSSKAGFITFVISMVFITTEIIIKKEWKNIVIYVVVPILVFGGSIFFFPVSTSRLQTAVETINTSQQELNATGESTADRLLIWKAALELSKNNLIIGTGTGDVKDELIKAYNEKGLKYPAQYKLNAHNQFINSLVTLGLPAMLLLISLLIIPLWYSIRAKNWLYFAFVTFFAFNIMVESMLEVQAGIVFFSLWNCLLWIDMRKSNGTANT